MSLTIVPYESKYDEGIRTLEQGVVQGKSIQLEMIKNHFLDRALVFKKYQALLAIGSTGNPVGTCIGARTTMIVNGDRFDAGLGFEVKVSPASRNKGVGKLMAKSTYTKFFKPEGLTKNFITLKKSNIPVIRLVSKAISRLWLYEFVYLTIPAKARVSNFSMHGGKKQLFSAALFDKEELPASYYTTFRNDLGYFHTYKMYQLKIRRVSFIYRLGILLTKKLWPIKYAHLPNTNEPFCFATLFNHHAGNIHNVNLVLEQLETRGINYLMVCCRKNDCIYNLFKGLSINTYGYYVMSDFPLKPKDHITLDVRCL